MNVLVLNSGSSSLKFQLFDGKDRVLVKGIVDGIGLSTCKVKYSLKGADSALDKRVKNHREAVKVALGIVEKAAPLSSIGAVGHRVVHGGERYKDAVKIDAKVVRAIDQLKELAPLHNPPNLAGILACRKLLPRVPQVAVFDTAFHQTIPKKAFLYGIPYEYYRKYKIRKYGFHGTSHKYVMLKAKKLLGLRSINAITCHLGNGASVAAIRQGESVDTSMGFTPLQGLMMGTRSGDVDPAVVAFIAEKEHLSVSEVVVILNKKSGLLGIGKYSDMRTVHERAVQGDEQCQLGLEMFAYRVCEYIGAYAGVLDRVDALVFTGGIGEGAYYLRTLICKRLANIGVRLDAEKNRKGKGVISRPSSKVKVLVIPTDEELMIARETRRVVRSTAR